MVTRMCLFSPRGTAGDRVVLVLISAVKLVDVVKSVCATLGKCLVEAHDCFVRSDLKTWTVGMEKRSRANTFIGRKS